MKDHVVVVGRAVVLVCAAVLSFSALYDLAVLCGFRPWQASLFPVMVDAGVAVALASWRANAFARRMTMTLLGTTVAGNATAHLLKAYELRPHWVVVVLVGALAPAVLAAAWRLDAGPGVRDEPKIQDEPATVGEYVETLEVPVQEALEAAPEEPAEFEVQMPVESEPAPVARTSGLDFAPEVHERALELVTAGAGRHRLMRECDFTEYQAKWFIKEYKPRSDEVAS